MKKITDIKEAQKSSRFNVFSDDGFEFSLSAKGIFECGVAVGKVFSDDEFEEIIRYVREETAFSKAVRFLGYRDYSEKELLQKLSRAGFDGTNAVKKLVELGYVNDRKYAEDFIRKSSETHGRFYIQNELYKKGIDKALADELLNEFTAQTDSAAFDVLCKKFKMKKFSEPKERNRAYAFLVRHGFGYEEISSALEKYEMVSGEEFSV